MREASLALLVFLTVAYTYEIEANAGIGGQNGIDGSADRLIFWTKPVVNVQQCAVLCAHLKLCNTWSYDPKTNLCEMIALSKDGPSGNNPTVQSIVLSQNHPCATNPCDASQVCVTVTSATGYRCLGLGIDCGLPSSFPNTKETFVDTAYGANVYYDCDMGYKFTGDNNMATCGPLSTWEGLLGQCEPVDCGTPVPPFNGIVTFSGTIFGSVASYSCFPGYNFTGFSKTANCSTSAQWAGFHGSCQIISCGPPDPVPNGNVTYSGTSYGSTATYTCDRGYNFTGSDNTVSCNTSAQWDTRDGECLTVDCGTPVPPFNGIVTFSGTTFGSVASYNCFPGYNFTGFSNTANCSISAQWVGFHGSCQIIGCGPPDPVLNGNVTYSGTSYGSTATYTCDRGYNFTGSDITVSCNTSAQWDTRDGECLIVDCGIPPDLNHTMSNYTSMTFNSIITYSCDTDYGFTGTTMVATCMETGAWAGIDGECVEYYINIAKGKTATQKSTHWIKTADQALIGRCADTETDSSPWWKVDLGQDYKIVRMTHALRPDCCANRMTTLYHDLQPACSDCPHSTCRKISGTFSVGSVFTYDCESAGAGFRYVTFQLSVYQSMTMCKVQIFIKNPALLQ